MKLLSGHVAWHALGGLARNVSMALSPRRKEDSAIFQDRMAVAWKAFDGPILLLLSGDDYTAKEFMEHASSSQTWSGALQKSKLIQHLEAGADHTMSQMRFNSVIENCTLDLLSQVSLH